MCMPYCLRHVDIVFCGRRTANWLVSVHSKGRRETMHTSAVEREKTCFPLTVYIQPDRELHRALLHGFNYNNCCVMRTSFDAQQVPSLFSVSCVKHVISFVIFNEGYITESKKEDYTRQRKSSV